MRTMTPASASPVSSRKVAAAAQVLAPPYVPATADETAESPTDATPYRARTLITRRRSRRSARLKNQSEPTTETASTALTISPPAGLIASLTVERATVWTELPALTAAMPAATTPTAVHQVRRPGMRPAPARAAKAAAAKVAATNMRGSENGASIDSSWAVGPVEPESRTT